MSDRRLTRNAAQCTNCGDVIESAHRRAWTACTCRSIFVDGGLDYQHSGAKTPAHFRDLSEYA